MNGLNAMIGHITYERVADHGPKKGAVTEKEPLTCEYDSILLYNPPVISNTFSQKMVGKKTKN